MDEQILLSLDLSVLSEEVIEVLLLDSNVEQSLLDEIAQKNIHRPKILEWILKHPGTTEATRNFIAQKLNIPLPEKVEEAADEYKHQRVQSMFQRIQKMRVGERIQLAIRGSRDIRSILLRDSSREVMLTVLDNPKITESEIEILAKQRTTPDEVLRVIAKKKDWLRNYSIMFSLVTNPKTPVGIALQNINALKYKDLLPLEKNRNLPEAIRAAIKRKINLRRQG